MASARMPSHQTERELREVTRPLAAIMHHRAGLETDVLRLREDTIKMADDREVGRFQAEKNRLKKAATKPKVEGAPEQPVVVNLPTEAEWLDACGNLAQTFYYKNAAAGQTKAIHMIDYASQEGYRLLDGDASILWFVQGWEHRINQRLQYGTQRVKLTLGTMETKKNGVTATIYFEMVTVTEYEAWLQLEAA